MHHSDPPSGPLPISSNSIDEEGPSIYADQKQVEQASDFPDGGWRAWSVVLGSWCAMVPSFGLLNTMGVLEAWLANDQLKDYSKASIGWIFGVYSFFLYFGSVQVGPVFDAYGLRPLLAPGCIGLIGSLMVFSVAKEYYQFMLGFSVLGGISSSMVFTPSVACLAHWFHRRRALATGIAATAGGFGGIIFPILIWNLTEAVGFPWAIRITGFICAFFCILCILFLKTRLPPKKLGGGKIDIRALREAPFALLTVAIFLIDFALLIPLTYITSYAQSHGMQESLAYQVVSILNAASILGRIVPGYFADRYGRFNVMIVTTFVCTVFTLALWLPAGSNTAAIVAYAVLFGFWSGSAISLAPVCVAQISTTEDFGKRYGTTYSLVSVGALFAIPIAGEIMKAQSAPGKKEDYSGLIVFCGLVYGCACLFFVLARGVKVGWRVGTIF
ncbi:MCT family MFS transporter [Aspergillus alliaceus]|uniref:MCT family MFS transporter n=1 Tax=Petromyces alliaceus TaxID=209559 RepID=UPI0012A76B85|nr:major facilitator superfamily domain-containing protein [Aspergillus alliaceus]KAB8238131.1 major facilitator superfamily domain-containing protein [Aspergillus alliaceus]